MALTKTDLAPERAAPVAAEVTALLAATRLPGRRCCRSRRSAARVSRSCGPHCSRSGPAARCGGVSEARRGPRIHAFRRRASCHRDLGRRHDRVDDRLVLSPPGIDLRVRGLHAQNRPAEAAQAGQRVALNIAGPRLSKDVVARGDWVLHPETTRPLPRSTLGSACSRMHRARSGEHAGACASRSGACDGAGLALDGPAWSRGSRRCPARVDRPIGALAGDRVVLRDAGAVRTIGGGVVLDPFPPRRGRRTPARLAQLACARGSGAGGRLAPAAGGPPGWTVRSVFFRARNMLQSRRSGLSRPLRAAAAELAIRRLGV